MEPETEAKEEPKVEESTFSKMWNLEDKLRTKETLLNKLTELNEELSNIDREINAIEQYFQTTLYINNLKYKYLSYKINKILAVFPDKVEFIEVTGDF